MSHHPHSIRSTHTHTHIASIAFWRDSRSIKAGPKITSPSLRLQHLQQLYTRWSRFS